MPFRPNFTALETDGSHVFVRGLSAPNDPAELDDILDIRVVLVQGSRTHAAPVDQVMSDWVATIPVADPAGQAGDFAAGDAVVFGIETRKTDARTITWAQAMPISAVEG